VGLKFLVYAAKMLTPGAIKSGFNICGVIELGPRELDFATIGDGSTPIFVT
jgi:hypothetical protein